MKYLFYKLNYDNKIHIRSIELSGKFTAVVWKPSVFKIIPKGISLFPSAVWWAMHNLNIFSNRNYCLYLIYNEKKLIHRSVVSPRYFRFPFMTKDDLQIGDTWTAPEYRGKSLATFAAKDIVGLLRKPRRSFWYIVEQDNISSIKVIEKLGFINHGLGIRKKRMGLHLLGIYELEK